MSEAPFIIERTYQASISKVWNALTDKDQMKKWYFDLPEFKAEIGFEFQFYGQGRKGEKYLHICKVTEVIFEKKLTYCWRYHNYPGNSFVSFELFEDGNNTRIKLTHEGIHSFENNNPDFAKESFAAGWTELISSSLKKFIED